MYKCKECENKFDVPMYKVTTYEYYYGISDGHKILFLSICPYCGSEEISQIRLGDEDELYMSDREND